MTGVREKERDKKGRDIGTKGVGNEVPWCVQYCVPAKVMLVKDLSKLT